MSEAKIKGTKMMLDFPDGRFQLIKVIKQWVVVLKHSDEGKNLSTSELVKKATDDVTSGVVNEEEIAKAFSKIKIVVEKKKEDGFAEFKPHDDEKRKKGK